MSYIRSMSNPEGLYIYANDMGITTLMGGPKLPRGVVRYIPTKLWNKLLETWVKNWYEDVALTLVIDGEKHEVSLTQDTTDGPLKLAGQETGLKLCIEYKNDKGKSWKLENIWPVTMHYIGSRYENPYYSAGRLKRLILRLLRV